MNKFLARIFYCIVPALIAGLIVGFLDFWLGIIIFVVIFMFGLEMTKPVAERGER